MTQLIIIGGGRSIQEGIEKGLWTLLKDKFTIGTNYSYKFFQSTIQTYVDTAFYNNTLNDLKTLPLVIGQGRKIEKTNRPPNTYVIPCTQKYDRNLKEGIYNECLVGIYALSLGIYLLDEGEIYLLGYDYGNIDTTLDNKNRKITHFYQGQIEHRGIGKTSWFDTKNRPDKDFGVYKEEGKIKIYNVGLKSKINTFEKISYDEFLKKLSSESCDQAILRQSIIQKLQNKFQ